MEPRNTHQYMTAHFPGLSRLLKQNVTASPMDPHIK